MYRGCAAEGRIGRRGWGETQQSYSVGGGSRIDNTHDLHNAIFTWKTNIYAQQRKDIGTNSVASEMLLT